MLGTRTPRWLRFGIVVLALTLTLTLTPAAGGVVGPAAAAVPTTVSPSAVAGGLLAGFPVEQFLAHWWVFPAAIGFSTVALSAGISGALFFSPFFMLVVGLSPSQAIGAGLLTEVFGMGNGLFRYVRQRVVDYQTAKWLLLGAVPAMVAGAVAAHDVDPSVLKLLFGVGLLVLAAFLVLHDAPAEADQSVEASECRREPRSDDRQTRIEARDGTVYTYDTCRHTPGVVLSTVGGFVTGLISAGLPEIVTTQLVVRCRVPPRVAVATSVFVLAIAAAAGAVVHALSATPALYVVAWSVPGVIVGGTVGTRVSKHVPSDLMETALGLVFAGVGVFVLVVEFVAP